jgi:glycosyltransferase involved in cell wall biosynthesis
MAPPEADGGSAIGSDGASPRITVVMPVLNGMSVLPQSVPALESSDLDPALWRLLVVDDGSTDGTADWIRARGHRVLSVPGGPLGPGAARNLGATRAEGDVLVFVDADVCVHPDVLTRFLDRFDREPRLGAAFGAYDTRPTAPGFVSQYRNLYHRYVHLRGAGDAETFWAGCGAVRREVFAAVGGFDVERFPRPQIEDIELGYRIRDAGWRIALDPEIESTHLKRWTFWSMVRTDLLDRGVPWMRLLLAEPRPESLNVGAAERLRTAGVGIAFALLAVALIATDWLAVWATLAVLAAVTLSNPRLFRWFAEQRSWAFAAGVIPFHLLFHFISGWSVVIAAVGHTFARVTPGGTPPTFENGADTSANGPDTGRFAPSREPR